MFLINLFFILDLMRDCVKEYQNIQFADLALGTESDTLCWNLKYPNLLEYTCMYIGRDDQTLFNLTVSLKGISLIGIFKKTYFFK